MHVKDVAERHEGAEQVSCGGVNNTLGLRIEVKLAKEAKSLKEERGN